MDVHSKSVLKKFTDKPWNIFLVDGIGAFFSSIVLIGILGSFDWVFKVPRIILYPLTGIAFMFSMYSFFCYFLKPRRWKLFLAIIIAFNIAYCMLTLMLVLISIPKWPVITHIYLIAEILVVCILVYFEVMMLKISKQT